MYTACLPVVCHFQYYYIFSCRSFSTPTVLQCFEHRQRWKTDTNLMRQFENEYACALLICARQFRRRLANLSNTFDADFRRMLFSQSYLFRHSIDSHYANCRKCVKSREKKILVAPSTSLHFYNDNAGPHLNAILWPRACTLQKCSSPLSALPVIRMTMFMGLQ